MVANLQAIDAARLGRAASHRRNFAQSLPGVNPGVVAVGESELDGVAAGQVHLSDRKVTGNAALIEQTLTRELVHALGTWTLASQAARRQARDLVRRPRDLKNTLVAQVLDVDGGISHS